MKDKKFEDALKELEHIVAQMESEGLGLDDSIKKYEAGIKLAKFCREKLDKAEKKIEILTRKPDGSVELKNFLDNTEPTNDTDLSTAEHSGDAQNDTKADEANPFFEAKTDISENNEQNIKAPKLSDSSEPEIEKKAEDIETNKIDEQVVPEKDDAVTCGISEKKTENEPEKIQSYNEGLEEDKPANKLDDKVVKVDKQKKVRELKPQKNVDSFEDLLF